MTSDQSAVLQGLLARLATGDPAARQELIGCAYRRLRCLARVILNESFPRLKTAPAGLETTDVANEAALGMYYPEHKIVDTFVLDSAGNERPITHYMSTITCSP